MAVFVTSPNAVAKTATTLGPRRIKNTNSRFRPAGNKVLVNWGWDELPAHVLGCGRIINNPAQNNYSGNKLTFFQRCGDNVNTVPWTGSKVEAEAWIDEGAKVVCRTVLRGHSGEGIVLAETKEALVDCQLYTKYIPKRNEYRVHVVNGRIFVQRKARDTSIPNDNVNWQIRNHQNGFIFAINENHEVPQGVTDEANAAIRFFGLDFGAVDVVWNEKSSKAYVLEINTAPGLENSTLDFYKRELINRLQ